MRLKSKLHATCVGIESSTVSGQGRGGQRGAGVWSERVPKLHTLRCTRFTLLAREGQGRGRGSWPCLCFALLCFAELDADADVDVGKAAHVLEKYALEEVLFHYVCVFLCVCVCGCWTCAGRAIYTLNGFCVDRKESQ